MTGLSFYPVGDVAVVNGDRLITGTLTLSFIGISGTSRDEGEGQKEQDESVHIQTSLVRIILSSYCVMFFYLYTLVHIFEKRAVLLGSWNDRKSRGYIQ
ncbi:hypothetical protein BACI349Y_40116 [Bacillus sp. 349Y]|nr:hypothetical protein BACI349Y_40116 [Bacillus sp. 349Y]